MPWMAFATVFGAALMAATGWFAVVSVRELGGYLQLVPLGVGFLMGIAFFLIGLWTLVAGRMQLVFDRVTGEGAYDVYSPVIEVGKPCVFKLAAIDSVTIERVEEDRPHQDDHGNFPAKVCRACLRVRKPRRTIVLDETENGREDRVQSVAIGVAAWLEVPVTQQS